MTVGELRALLAPHNEHRQVMATGVSDEDLFSGLLLVTDVELDNTSQHGTVVAIRCETP